MTLNFIIMSKATPTSSTYNKDVSSLLSAFMHVITSLSDRVTRRFFQCSLTISFFSSEKWCPSLLHINASLHNCVVHFKQFVFSLKFTTNVSNKLQEYEILEVFGSFLNIVGVDYLACHKVYCAACWLCTCVCKFVITCEKDNKMSDLCVLFEFNVHYDTNCWLEKELLQ